MRIQLNGQPLDLPQAMTLDQLIVHLGQTGRRCAIELNREIVPRSHDAVLLQDGDVVELVQAMGGG